MGEGCQEITLALFAEIGPLRQLALLAVTWGHKPSQRIHFAAASFFHLQQRDGLLLDTRYFGTQNRVMPDQSLRLDDLYRMTSHIYSEQNAHRPASATFAHFIEVCGMLTVHARNKKREEVSFEDALCKALGWFFPLMAKFKVTSIEELVYRKYPYVCPYCREAPHVDKKCKTVVGTKKTVDHAALRAKYVEHQQIRPTTLNQWQQMFDKIYPRALDDTSRSVVALFEELGELAEAIRVFDRFPKYFAGEAADVFSYLMGLANEYSLQQERDDKPALDLEGAFLKRFPGLCVQCGYSICVCPLVPDATVGRMAKELEIGEIEQLFKADFESFRQDSIEIAERVLAKLGGYPGLAGTFPFDRGDTNRSLVLLCLKLADASKDEQVAARLRSAALKVGSAVKSAGTKRQSAELAGIIEPVEQVMRELPPGVESVLGDGDPSPVEKSVRVVIGELVMGDKYVADNVGAQGRIASANDTRFTEIWAQSQFDLPQLAEELKALRNRLSSDTPSSQVQTAVQSVSDAQAAAERGDGPGTLEKLSKAGKWVAKVATDIGVQLAAAAIQRSYLQT